MIHFAQYGLLLILSIFLVLHFLILLKFIPYNVVWGGRLKSDSEMYRFEMVSIVINLFFLFIILVQSSILTIGFPKKIITILLWFMTALFAFNTFGNIKSKSKIEQIYFTPITIVLTIFSIILALTN
jgi:hypothetical protein